MIETQPMSTHFLEMRKGVIGDHTSFESCYGEQALLYADWVASGRLYEPIERIIQEHIGPMIANPHSFSSETGKGSTYAYKHARKLIKDHVNAHETDVLVTAGSGMTTVLARFQRMMGLRWPDARKEKISVPEEERPVVFITHMEHHSNHVPWMETIADVVMVPCDEDLLVRPALLREEVEKYKHRPLLLGAFTACSNVTGIITPYHELAKVMHEYGGFCFVDFAASAPYVKMDMHPQDEAERLDAIYFSPHKFLGGPGSCGVLVFNEKLYTASCPDVPGGGNVKWTSPDGAYEYTSDIETKEDGGTPGFLQVMRAALAMQLKDKMKVTCIEQRERELLDLCFSRLENIPGCYILGGTEAKRIGCVSFGVEGIHYNLIVRLLNDRFGIQVRGGWSCASTYAHHLFHLSAEESKNIINGIQTSNLASKPGWVRVSLHPVTTDEEVIRITDAVAEIVENIRSWEKDYTYNQAINEFESKTGDHQLIDKVKGWFEI